MATAKKNIADETHAGGGGHMPPAAWNKLVLHLNMYSPKTKYYSSLSYWIIKGATLTCYFQSIRLIDLGCWYKFTDLMSKNADPDQLASSTNLELNSAEHEICSSNKSHNFKLFLAKHGRAWTFLC